MHLLGGLQKQLTAASGVHVARGRITVLKANTAGTHDYAHKSYPKHKRR